MYAKDRLTVVDRREMLRVKVKNLADEARTIRKEELRSWGQLREELWQHRIKVVRAEARSAHIAYGLIRGRTLAQMEAKSETPPDWPRINTLTKKYGPASFAQTSPTPAPAPPAPAPKPGFVKRILSHSRRKAA